MERVSHVMKTQSQTKGQREIKGKETKTEQTGKEKVLREVKIFWLKKNPHKLSIELVWEHHLDSVLSNFQAARNYTYFFNHNVSSFQIIFVNIEFFLRSINQMIVL